MANVQIYNASAGSGKTFTLVKSFLQLILATKNVEAYKTLLAIYLYQQGGQRDEGAGHRPVAPFRHAR